MDGAEPSLSAAADDGAREQYDRWLPGWRRWAADEAANRRLQVDYAALDGLRRGADDRGDTHELVLGVGLLTCIHRGHLSWNASITRSPAHGPVRATTSARTSSYASSSRRRAVR